MELLKPFGPSIGKVEIENNIFQDLLTITDNLLKDPNRVNMGHSLAGHIKEQINIPKSILKDYGLLDFFAFYVDNFLFEQGVEHDENNLTIDQVWLNSMYKHEWNPPHIHNGTVSTILVLKVPDLPLEEGEITFINNSNRMAFELESGLYNVTPKEKDFFIFPARLTHNVTPFSCEGERRTISFNATLTGHRTVVLPEIR